MENNKERRGPKIESWETIETLVDHKDYFGKMDFGFKIAIEQPIAEGGKRLYKRLNSEVRFGRHFIRLNTKALTQLLRLLDEYRDVIEEAAERVHHDNDEMRREDQTKRERTSKPGARRPGGPGDGLSRFSGEGEGKTARKRRKTRGDEPRVGRNE